MRGQERTSGTKRSTMRKALEAVLLRSDGRTIIEECRRCGKTIESTPTACPCCGCRDIAEYRIQ